MTTNLAPAMLSDGSNPEGVDPVPALAWSSKDDLRDVVVHGPAFSHGTTKIRLYLNFAGIPFTHQQNLDTKPQGMKPGTPYQKVPVIDVAGRQVNDSAIIVKHLLPLVGLAFDKEWEDRLVLVLDTTFKLRCSGRDWANLAIATMGAPRLLRWPIGLHLRRMERSQAKHNIATTGLGHREGDELEIGRDFKAQLQGRYFHGDEPGHVDLSMYGFLVGFLYSKSPIALRMVSECGLQDWVDAMVEVAPFSSLYGD